ncbi:MAG: outer membrane lipoprotein carrier protein LolA [Saprospiraceae bacterium]|nr:outer membrane lipoprotein carrier protein LolA [Saprospiraceae bacterium]
MRELFFSLLFLAAACSVFGQQNTLSKASDSDPAAKALLQKVRTKYEAYKSVEADFSLTIKIPEQAEEVQKGKLVQQGNQYRLDFTAQSIFFDGVTLWLYLKSLNEVQITDADFEAEGMLSPKDLLTIYEKDDYVYALTSRIQEGGRNLQQIEFKPLQKDFEYNKLRVSVDINTNEVIKIEAFGKDASRYTLKIDKITSNKVFPTSYFKFEPKNYPGVYVEDLR